MAKMQNEGPPVEVLEDLREQGRQHEERYQELVAQALAEREKLGTVYALHMWARNVDERGQVHTDRSIFRPVPMSPSPMPHQQNWYDFPLNWGEQEMSDIAITEVRGG